MRLKKKILVIKDILIERIKQDDQELDALEQLIEQSEESYKVEAYQDSWRFYLELKKRHEYVLDILDDIRLGKPIDRIKLDI